MQVETFFPTLKLKNYIESYMIINADKKSTKAIIPQTAFTLSFKVSGDHEYLLNKNKGVITSSAITGLRKEIKYPF